MTRFPAAVARCVSGRLSAWFVIVAAVAIGGGLIAAAPDLRVNDDLSARLPAAAQSTRVAELQKELPSGSLNPALVVYSRPGGTLSDADLRTIAEQGERLGPLALDGRVSPPQPAPDGTAALVVVPLSGEVPGGETAEAVEQIRQTARTGLPDGVIAQVTGGAGFTADLQSAFAGADVKLLITTASVVALLLLITYRSPILWIIPLAVVGVADRLTSVLVAIASQHTSLAFNESTNGIVSVLVFGAGTDYALLLIARYREELRREPDRRVAMRRAWIGAAPAIGASGATVILALLTLLAATFGSNTAIGVGGAIGIVVALVFGLVVLPAALVVCPRGLFWPLVPHVTPRRGLVEVGGRGWRRIGTATARRPVIVITASLLVLAALSAGTATTGFGLSQEDTFRTKAEAVDGLKTLSAAFPAGTVSPVAVMTTPALAKAVSGRG